MRYHYKDIIVNFLLWIVAVIMIYPIVWMVTSSLKSSREIFTSPGALPKHWIWGNYTEAWFSGKFNFYFFNSFLISISSVMIILFAASLAAYALSRFEFRGRDMIFYIFMGALMIPRQVIIIPLFVFTKQVGLCNSRLGLTLVYAAFWLPLSLLILRAFFLTLPKEIEDAAIIDGCSRFRVFWNIMLPMVKPALAATAVFSFVYSWNEFLFALIFLRDDIKKTLPIGLTTFVGEHETNYPLLFAGLSISTIPMLVVYFILHKQITKGLTTAGAFK